MLYIYKSILLLYDIIGVLNVKRCKKYTIVDILSTNIIQFHYNSCVFGSHNVSLFGETNFNACFLNLMPCDKFDIIRETYDVVCNFDGLTEYGISTAMNYINKSKQITKKE